MTARVAYFPFEGDTGSKGIKSAFACARPACIPQSRPRGAKAAGLRYERRFIKSYPNGKHGQWFYYETPDGKGHYCQTDVLISFLPKVILVLELKYTYTSEAVIKLRNLYIPVVRAAFKLPAFGAVVSKNLTPNPGKLAYSLSEAVSIAKTGLIPTLHWVGQPLN